MTFYDFIKKNQVTWNSLSIVYYLPQQTYKQTDGNKSNNLQAIKWQSNIQYIIPLSTQSCVSVKCLLLSTFGLFTWESTSVFRTL